MTEEETERGRKRSGSEERKLGFGGEQRKWRREEKGKKNDRQQKTSVKSLSLSLFSVLYRNFPLSSFSSIFNPLSFFDWGWVFSFFSFFSFFYSSYYDAKPTPRRGSLSKPTPPFSLPIFLIQNLPAHFCFHKFSSCPSLWSIHTPASEEL
jgi:hypothetical protein